jgi:glycosyltransferase involved in cell wall biosynthesis
MKLLLHSHYFAPSIGGVESAVQSLAAGISDYYGPDGEKIDVTVVTNTPRGSYQDQILSFRVVRQPSFFQLGQLIRGTDVVHIAGPALSPMSIAWVLRKPFVIEHHGYQAICPNGLFLQEPTRSVCVGHFQAGHYGECFRCLNSETSRLRSGLRLFSMFPRNWLTRAATLNLAISNYVRDRHRLPGTRVVYYGIEDPVPLRTGDEPARRVIMAFVGRFVSEKGLPVLLQAVALLKREGLDFEVRLIGDGPERGNLEDIIRREDLGNIVKVAGFLRGEEMVKALSDVRVVVIPSVCEETAGLAAIEQMMRGRLVIASNIGGLGEVVGDAGLRCEPGNVDSLASCMKSVILDRSLIDSIGMHARKRATQLFMRARMIQEHATIYGSIFQNAHS